jgi:ABC-type multidrug transport system fused ATPase/permease subunit
MGLFMSGMEVTGSVSQVIIIGVGGLLLMKNQINLVDLITFSLYVSTFVSPIRKLAQFSEYYMQGMAGFTRFLELMNTEPDIVDEPDAKELKEVFQRVKTLSANAKSPYAYVRKWFEKQFPDYRAIPKSIERKQYAKIIVPPKPENEENKENKNDDAA